MQNTLGTQSTLRRLLTRNNFFSLLSVLLLFAVLPLSQVIRNVPEESMLVVREVDLAPPPPTPPEQRDQNVNATGGSQGGLSLAAIPNSVELTPIALGAELGSGASSGLGFGGFDVGSRTNLTFNMEGIGFGTSGLDRTPVMLVKPTVPAEFMNEIGISEFAVELTVRMHPDGSLTLISIDSIQYPYAELEQLVRQAIPNIRYSQPTVDGQPVERVVRLPLNIVAR